MRTVPSETPTRHALHGTWHLVSFTRTIVATGEVTDVFGEAPRGFITYGDDGRMMVLIVRDGRPKPGNPDAITDQEALSLFRGMAAYGGTYTCDGKTVVHHVDISWNEIWTGTDQVRDVKFEGNRLVLSTSIVSDQQLVVYAVTWEKAKA